MHQLRLVFIALQFLTRRYSPSTTYFYSVTAIVPQIVGIGKPGSDSLPYASSLCGACYQVCPVKINIPEVLVHLRAKVVEQRAEKPLGRLEPERLAMQTAARTMRCRAWQPKRRCRPCGARWSDSVCS